MKIALAQLNYHIGNFEENANKIIEVIELQKQANVDLVVFSELSVCGYPARDFLDYNEFIEKCEHAAQEIATHCTSIACIIGLPMKNILPDGKDLFNVAYFIEAGVVKQIIKKALLPTYDVFDEYRYFEPNYNFACVDFKGYKIALTICEDLWNLGENPLYKSCPMDELIIEDPDVMINIAASPFDYLHDIQRKDILIKNCKKYHLPLIYVNHVGAQTDLIFDGGSVILNRSGKIIKQLAFFEEEIATIDLETLISVENSDVEPARQPIELIYQALVLGIKDYFRKSGFNKATFGLSGGIDSAVVCALACEALGAENVLAVLLPSKYSSDHSINDALELANNLGCKHVILPISDNTDAFENTLKPIFAGLPNNITEENIQARTRGTLLMAISNKLGYILLNTSNKSETAVGYGTLYGDMCGAISVLGDCYKTQVYDLAKYINSNKVIIPQNTIDKAPSAELRPNQKDSDSLPDYGVLDKILFEYIENEKSAREILDIGYPTDMVKKVLRLVNNAEFKRYQTPPILRISFKAFGMGRRMPIVSKYEI